MAETRATTNSEKIAALAVEFEGHDLTLLEMKQQLGVISQFMQKEDQRLSNAEVQVQEENQRGIQNVENSIVVSGAKLLRLEFPYFSGVDSASRIYKSNKFFAYYSTPEHQKFLMAYYQMEGEALIWFQDAENSGLFNDWEAFVKATHVRFGAVSYDDPMESLTRLKQTSSVIAYKGQFEAISNRVQSLSEPYKLSCFLSGLKDEVRLIIRMLSPKNLNEAFGLAKMQQEYLWSCRKSSKISHDGSRPSILGIPEPEHSISTSDSRTKVPLQRLTAAQMEEMRKKGLCYHCDEKQQSGHQCKGARIFLLEGVSFSQDLPSSGPQLVELEADGSVVLPEG